MLFITRTVNVRKEGVSLQAWHRVTTNGIEVSMGWLDQAMVMDRRLKENCRQLSDISCLYLTSDVSKLEMYSVLWPLAEESD